ncbi:MAG: histidine kinase dimerization/phosphoacceptor domain -containing protein [Pseudomonadota bacterium]
MAALRRFGVLDTPPEPLFDGITSYLARVCETPIAAVNLIDAERQFFKSQIGLNTAETPLGTSLCAFAILEERLLEVPDTTRDPRFRANPQCTGDGALRFYAGAPLMTPSGLPIGALCVIDVVPRTLTPLQRGALEMLAMQVMAQLEMRRALHQQQVLAREANHRIKNALQNLSAMARMDSRAAFEPETRLALQQVEARIGAMGGLHALLQDTGTAGVVDLGAYLDRVALQLAAQAAPGIQVEARVSALSTSASKAASLGIILAEWVTNAFKHAFPAGRAGIVEISLIDTGAGTAQLQVADDGIGIAGPPPPPGTGSQIIEAAMHNIDGTATADVDRSGLRQRLIFVP